jgi:glycosyltransferase involved in cell wall biosynthesis
MRIAHFCAMMAGQIGFEHNVSGHVQIPIKCAALLRDAGHHVRMITTRFGSDRSLPAVFPKDMPLDCVDDARNRGGIGTRTGPSRGGANPLVLARQVRQLKRLCDEHAIDVLHLHGATRTAYLAAMLRVAGLRAHTAVSLSAPVRPGRIPGPVSDWALRRAGLMVASTQFLADNLRSHGVDSVLIRHGSVRLLRQEHGWQEHRRPRRVLYWRDPTENNGMDIARDVFRALAPKFPDVIFTMAIRPIWCPVPGIDELAREFPNVEVHKFPYENGVTLAGLMSESLCVFMPFRINSFDPQLVLLESLEAGVPVVTSNCQSNPEIVIPGRTGAIVPTDDNAAVIRTLESLLSDREGLLRMGENARAHIARNWNWNSFADSLTRAYESVLGTANAGAAEAVPVD